MLVFQKNDSDVWLSNCLLSRMLYYLSIPLFVAVISYTPYAYSGSGDIYLGLLVPYNTVKGGFNGRSHITSIAEDEIHYVPKLEDNIGQGFTIGMQERNSYALELSYARSKHDAEYLVLNNWKKTTATDSYLNMDLIFMSSKHRPIQTLMGFGFGLHSLIIKNGSTGTTLTGTVKSGDADYKGLSINMLVGIRLRITKMVGFRVNAVYHLGTLNTIEGALSRREDLEKSLGANGLSYVSGLYFQF